MSHSTIRLTTLALLALASSSVSAGTLTTWSGTAANARWNTNGNWTTKPNTSGTFSLVFSGTGSQNSNNDIGTVKIDSLSFANTGTTNQTRTYFLGNSGTLQLTAGGNVSTSAAVAGTLTDTIASPVAMLGTGNFSIGNNHNLSLTGTVSGNSIVKTGGGDLSLTGATTLSGATPISINEGSVTLSSTSANALVGKVVGLGGAGTAGTLKLNTLSGSSNVQFSLNGDAFLSPQQGSNLTFSNAVFNVATAGSTPVTLGLAGGNAGLPGTQIIDGVIQDNSVSGKVGVTIYPLSGTSANLWVLNGANTYTGNTTIGGAAKVLVNGSVASDLTTSSGYLGGSGTFSGAVSVTSGTLAPGGNALSGGVVQDSFGKLTVGTLTLGSGATTAMAISGTGAGLYDQIVVGAASNLNYAGVLALTLSGSYADGTTFDLFSGFATQTGAWSSITLDAAGSPYAGLTFGGPTGEDWYSTWTPDHQRLKFSESTGTLTVVPEPSTIVFAGIGMAMFGWSAWTRRRSKVRRQAIETALA